jgi:DNA-binding Lrp family transcriptional regulator
MNRPLSEKQKRILKYLHEHGEIDFDTVRSLIDDHYCNGGKHCSETMTRMVKQGIVKRIKKGVFVLGSGRKPGNPLEFKNQVNLFA